ncbi:MAG: ADP-ribosylation factor-like protein [Candidatus Hodarchaeales archaeon]|jgi:small GTP-binding protein
MKIAILGLDAAGKTSFISTLRKKYSEALDPQPTKGISRTALNILGVELNFWDFGGQEAYRSMHLSKPESLASVDLVLYLIDVTDTERFDESIEYLSSLKPKLDIDHSRFVFCLHKADPDRVMADDAILQNISLGSEKLRETMPGAQIFETSIFSPPTILSAVSVGIQQTVTKGDVVETQLKNFAEQTGSMAVNLLTSEALSFGTYADSAESETISETLGFSFVEAWETMASRGHQPVSLTMQLKHGWAFFLRVLLDKDFLFLVIYAEAEEALGPILSNIPDFAEKISDVVRAFDRTI